MFRKKKLKRVIKRINRNAPYALPRHTPPRLRKLWFQLLFVAKKKYLLIYLYSTTLWKIWFLIQLFSSKKYKFLSSKEQKELLQIVFIDNIPVSSYFFYNLHSSNQWNQRHNYIRNFNLLHCRLDWNSTKEASILNDKNLFYKVCKKNKFFTPKIYASIIDKKWNQLETYPWEERKDFILKTIRGSKGNGFIRFLYDKVHQTYQSSIDNGHFTFSPDQIETFLKSWFKKKTEDYLIQEKLENHPTFANLCNDAVAGIRLLSMVNQKGEIQLFRPIFQMPQGDAILNYYHKGALVTPVDIKTGKLGKIISQSDNLLSHHPKTNHLIAGLVLPYWEEIKTEVIRFHHLLSNQPLIGWDIVITPNGFSFLEGNITPSLDIHQKTPFTPFIGTEFYELFIYHLFRFKGI